MFFRNDDKKDPSGKRPPVRTVPLLPLRDIIVFPHMVVPLFVGREKSIAALEEAMSHDKDILLAAQKKAKTNEPAPDDIFEIGTLGTILQLLRLPDGTVKVLVEGKRRARVRRYTSSEKFFLVEAEEVEEISERNVEVEALVRSVHATFEAYVKLNKRIPPEMLMSVATIDDPARLADTIVAHLSLKLNDKQAILEEQSAARRLEKLYELMQGEIEILQVEKKIRTRVKKQMEKTQKEYYLNEQMQAIQKELGERDEFKSELQELEDKIKNKKMSKEATAKAKKELRKLKMMSPMSAEATVVRNYIDWILSLPWYEYTKDKLDIADAEKILNDDHYGLKKVKERILEYLAVQAMVEKMRGPILCFVGPPGVGKTSIGKSIARALGRKFIRVSLGGVRDEAEIRGHRRTYIGALPGRILQGIRTAGSRNPVFILDEVDKLGMDFRGDPSSALLEALDPEQNREFSDHYLEVPYDLSQVLFITTANLADTIHPALLDRMELIRIPGYTEEEKLHIARRYLVPRQMEEHAVAEEHVVVGGEVLRRIVREYTHEAGVRNLEREIANLVRKVPRRLAEGETRKWSPKPADLEVILGPPRFDFGLAETEDQVGAVTGVAVNEYGGDVMTVEAIVVPGEGDFTLTGQLGKVMEESARAAWSYARVHAARFNVEASRIKDNSVHIHVPAGGIPKDGPSAGGAKTTAIVSALTGRAVHKDVAMTGEITLRGRVLPIGGLKEKMLAAHPARNK